MKIHAKITYTIDDGHPDIECIHDWNENKVYTFEDTYIIDDCYTFDDAKSYIESDLSLVAGGGYNSKHIHNVKFEISRV